MKNTAMRDTVMANIRACLATADAKYAKTRYVINAPLLQSAQVMSQPQFQSPLLSFNQATQLDDVMQAISTAVSIQNRINEQIAIYNLPFRPLKMMELSILNEMVVHALNQYRGHLSKTAPTLLGSNNREIKPKQPQYMKAAV